MKNVAIIPNPTRDIDFCVTKCVVAKLIGIGISCYMDKSLAYSGINANYYDDLPQDIDLIIVIGGDGSVIQASALSVGAGVPLVGVNLGKVGYLSEVDPENLNIFDALVSGEYWVKEKMLLSVSTAKCDDEPIRAVNDIVVSHGGYLGLSTFKLEDGNGNSLVYRADGIVFATPQGSTAYSLSAGGPVVAHDVDTIVVTPVCPHSFFNRSVLFNAAETLTVTNMGGLDMKISVDGRYYSSLSVGQSCAISMSNEKLKMLTFSNNSMFTELFTKMKLAEGIK